MLPPLFPPVKLRNYTFTPFCMAAGAYNSVPLPPTGSAKHIAMKLRHCTELHSFTLFCTAVEAYRVTLVMVGILGYYNSEMINMIIFCYTCTTT